MHSHMLTWAQVLAVRLSDFWKPHLGCEVHSPDEVLMVPELLLRPLQTLAN